MAANGQNNPWFAVSMGLLGLIVGYGLSLGVNGGLLALQAPSPTPAAPTAPTAAAPTPAAPTNETPASVGNAPVLGKASATVTIIEFTDFQCPFCARHFTQTFGQIKKDYIDTGKVKYALRNYPLPFHQNAQKAAEAAACAHQQGKFWEMHDVLFEKQNDWSSLAVADAAKAFKGYATDIGLGAGKFASCFDGSVTAADIKKDIADGQASGIDGTPGFWILGPGGKNQKISGAYPYDTFKNAFDAMLKG